MAGHLRDVTLTIAEREHDVRNRLNNNESTMALLPDMVSRAYGLLQYAHRLEYGEYINALSMIRLGVVMGYLEPMDSKPVEFISYMANLSLLCAPYHMNYHSPACSTAAHEIARTAFSRTIKDSAVLTLELMRDIFQNSSVDD